MNRAGKADGELHHRAIDPLRVSIDAKIISVD
jgi:hypothetical protein